MLHFFIHVPGDFTILVCGITFKLCYVECSCTTSHYVSVICMANFTFDLLTYKLYITPLTQAPSIADLSCLIVNVRAVFGGAQSITEEGLIGSRTGSRR